VSIDEPSCPFCGAVDRRQESSALRSSGNRGARMSRAALFASATLATAAACGGGKPKPVDTTNTGSGSETVQAVDAGTEPADAPNVRVREQRLPNMPYGAPPARRRVV
jgi:hypothetical protein